MTSASMRSASKNTSVPEYLRGAFLTNYLFFDAAFRPFLTPEALDRAYREYADIFCIGDDEWLDHIYGILNTDIFTRATGLHEFNMLSRTASLYPECFSGDEKYLISLRGTAMRVRTERLGNDKNMTCDRVLLSVESAAKHGDTDCIGLMSYMLYNGVLVRRSTARALKDIARIAEWNSQFGLLMGMRYGDGQTADDYMSRLRTVMNSSSVGDSFDYIAESRGVNPADVPDNELALALEKAFNRQAVTRSLLSAPTLRMLRSPVLSDETKKQLLARKSRDDSFAGLPLNIRTSTPFCKVVSLDNRTPLVRADELEHVRANLGAVDVHGRFDYKPLLLVCEDSFVLDEYKKIISATLAGRKFGSVDAADPGQSCSGGSDNAIITTLDKLGDAGSVIFVENCDALSAESGRELVSFLRSEYRSNYRIASPSVCLDLSDMLPVLFATEEPCREICEAADVLHLRPMSPEERRTIISQVVADKAGLFGLSDITLTERAYDELERYSMPQVSRMLDRAISTHRRCGESIELDAAALESESYGDEDNKFFWRGNK